jgi:UDP-glucose:(heptosyl)LPS alpha-1,3-glucosyltransferase
VSRSVVQIVRRFGCVGGMESYVWFLSHELLQLGYQVVIICEECEGQPDPAIDIIVVPGSTQRRRWKAMKDFNSQLDQLFQSRPQLLRSIIHSHERTAWHHVTTFHGPPMKKGFSLPWYKRFSRRLAFWLDAEYRELCAAQVQRVVPVSKMIGVQLLDQYPTSQSRMTDPAYPALAVSNPQQFREHGREVKVLFVGKEWKRKGLGKAVEVCGALAEKFSVEFDVFGVSVNDLPKELKRSFINYHGYKAEIPFAEYDLLIHPAVSEPFGMVVTEALSNGCRALISDQVGAAERNHDGLVVIELDASLSEWVDAAIDLVEKVPDQLPRFETWADVAVYYNASVYASVSV